MTDLLEWRYAAKQDRLIRNTFTCADPPKRRRIGARRLFHPRPWEIEVQSWVRSHPLQPDELMLIGTDTRGALGALVAWTDIGGSDAVLIQAIAVSVTYRRRGGAWAQEAMTIALREIRQRAKVSGHPAVTIAARIHHGNLPSQRLFAWAGFTKDRSLQPGLDEWALLLAVGPSSPEERTSSGH